MPHNKAILEMDGQEIELQIKANEHLYALATAKLDLHRAMQYRIMIDKLHAAKRKFHEEHAASFAQRYGITININVNGQREQQP